MYTLNEKGLADCANSFTKGMANYFHVDMHVRSRKMNYIKLHKNACRSNSFLLWQSIVEFVRATKPFDKEPATHVMIYLIK